MLSVDQLMNYLKDPDKHSIKIKSNQRQQLRNIGYYHGFKGYRFIRTPIQRIPFSSFDEILALNQFDMQLKSLFYSKVMFVENALKNYAIEAVLKDSDAETLDAIFNKSITYYQSFAPGSEQYKKEYTKRMQLKVKITSALIRDYSHHQQIVNHFFDNDKNIPIWAIFESLSLGEFGTFFSCLKKDVKLNMSSLLNLPAKKDADGKLAQYIIYTIKDLRNAIAHNDIIFDTRFQIGRINGSLINVLQTETGITIINFKSIDFYFILITYVLRKMTISKTECKQFIHSFITITETLRSRLPVSIYNQIIGTNIKPYIQQLEFYISHS